MPPAASYPGVPLSTVAPPSASTAASPSPSSPVLTSVRLSGGLAAFESLAWHDWPPWARAQFGRVHRPLRGASAVTVQMRDAGVPCGRGCATSSLAEQIDAAPCISWSLSARRALARDAFDLLRSSEAPPCDATPPPSASSPFSPLLVFDADGLPHDLDDLALDAFAEAEAAVPSEPPSTPPGSSSLPQIPPPPGVPFQPTSLLPLAARAADVLAGSPVPATTPSPLPTVYASTLTLSPSRSLSSSLPGIAVTSHSSPRQRPLPPHAADRTNLSAGSPASGVSPPPLHGWALVGMRIRVHWPDDAAWYVARVTTYSRRRGYCLRYDHLAGEQDRTDYESLDDVEWELMTAATVPRVLPSSVPSVRLPPATSDTSSLLPSPAAPPVTTVVRFPPPSLPPPPPPPPQRPVPRRPPPPSALCASLDWVLENPVNALWLMLFTKHPRFGRWQSVVLSYCKLRSCATRYRKTTRFLSSLPSAATYPPPCTPNAPCAATRHGGTHAQAIGDNSAGRALLGYYERSHVPASLVADFLSSAASTRLTHGVSRLLLLDLCSGWESARAGLAAYRHRAAWVAHRAAGCELSYVSVDNNPKVSPMLSVDLLEADLNDVVVRACALVGWPPSTVAVLVWFSPPCETYSSLTLGTGATAFWGGPQRQGKDSAYTPVRGGRGAKARAADRLVCRVLSWLHRNSNP